MIETIENAVQLALIAVCLTVSCVYVVRKKPPNGRILIMFYASYLLGDLYWLLYLMCYGHTPAIFYVSDLSWYAAYTFLALMLHGLFTEEERKEKYWPVYLPVLFTGGMCVFYMQWGDYFGNLMSAMLMSILMIHSVRGLIFIRKHPEAENRRMMCLLTLVFCVLEYCVWTVSCYMDEYEAAYYTYIGFDVLLTVSMILFLPAFRKAVKA